MKDQRNSLDDASRKAEERHRQRERPVHRLEQHVEESCHQEVSRDSEERDGKARQEQPFMRPEVGRGGGRVVTDDDLAEDVKLRLEKYAEFIDSSPAYVVTEALKLLFNKDAEFKSWLGQHTNNHEKAEEARLAKLRS